MFSSCIYVDTDMYCMLFFPKMFFFKFNFKCYPLAAARSAARAKPGTRVTYSEMPKLYPPLCAGLDIRPFCSRD